MRRRRRQTSHRRVKPTEEPRLVKAGPQARIETDSGALVEPFAGPIDVEAAFARLAARPHCLFLDSARRDATLGRYSFLTADPFDYLELPADGSDALAELPAAFKTAGVRDDSRLAAVSRRSRRSVRLRPGPIAGAAAAAGDRRVRSAGAGGRAVRRRAGYRPRPAIRHGSSRKAFQTAATQRPAGGRAAQRLEQFRAWLAEPVPPRTPIDRGARRLPAASGWRRNTR